MVTKIQIPGVKWDKASGTPVKTTHTITHTDNGTESTHHIRRIAVTRNGCNETGHQYVDCPHRRTAPLFPQQTTHINTWAKILINGQRTKQQDEEKRERREEKGAPLDAHKTDAKNTRK